MTKKIKNYKMPSLFVSLFFIIIIFFSSKSVFGVSNIPEKGELHETYYNICGLDVRNNEALFCVQPMTDMLWENNGNKKYKYKVVGKISIDSQKKEFKREGNTSKLKSDDAAISIIAFTDYSKTDKYKKNVEEYKEGSKSYIKGLTPWEQIVITDPTQYLIWYLHEGAIRADGEKKWDEIIEKMDANGVFKDNTEKEFFSIFSKVAFVLWFRDMPVTPTKADILARKEIKADQSVEPKIDYDASKNNEVLAKRVQNLPTGTNLEDYIVVGPYRYSASGEDCISQILVKKNGENNYNDIKPGSNILVLSKTPEGTYKPIYSLDEKNNIINDKISPEFYVLVRKNKGIAKIDDLKLIFKRTEIKGTIYYLSYTGGTDSQNLIYVTSEIDEKTYTLNYKVNLIPPVQVELDKVDTAGAAVSSAKFSIEYSNGLKGETKTVGTDGKIKFSQLQPTSPDSFTATITETFTPSGYKTLEKPIELKFTYDSNNAVWKVEKTSGPDEKVTIGTVTKDNKSGTVKIPIKVENKSIIEKLTLLKTSSVSGGKVEGAKFKLTLTNVASIKNHQIPEAGEVTIIETTNSDGNLVLEDIEIKNLNEPVVITIEEIEAPVGYKKIEGTITVTLKREGNGYNISETKKDSTVTDDEFKAGKVTLKNHELELNIKDIPVMNLGGIVWTEKIQTGKEQPEINNQYDGENQDEALAGIKVSLYKNGKKVAETTSSDENQKATYTDHKGNKVEVNLAKGEYMFTDITAGDDYYVVFEYDGIKYQAMTNSKEQAYTTKARDTKIAEEPNRKDFNANTKEISGTGEVDKSKTDTGWIIEYDLDNNSTPNKAIYKDVKNKNGELQYVEGKTYTYLSKTEDWMGTWNTDGTINKSHYAFNINCGLSKKSFDLSLGTDVKDATVTINGNQTTYTYDQILDGKLNEALNRPSSEKKIGDNKIEYNLYLAVSDYNYRIADYKVPGEGSIENKYDAEALNKEQIDSAKKDSELEVYVTYRIELKNQSTQHDAKVNLVEYHFDEHYQYVSIKNATAEKDPNARVLYITPDEGIEAGRTLLPNIEITFKVLPDGKGNKCVLGEDYLNQAEIISYTTGGGLVDEDSAPGNAFLEEGKVRYEDDTDEANGIQIKLKENAERSISGKVFDDDDTSDKGINDVIVQLIELVEINNKQYEYIWQETVAGSNKEDKSRTVKTTARNGYVGENYTVTNEAGEYKFTQRIIPGNYIVRFIYGDGRIYDITENTLKYNGEDYKSTYVDYDYNAEWYNNTSLNGENSKAVDNEARRLRVMSYAVDVDGTKGAELALLSKPIGTNNNKLKDVLDNTWMCAETLKIKVPVDPSVLVNENGEKEEKLSITENSTSVKKADSQYKVTFDNVNLGLMERPKTKLVLEKHITGLTIKPVASGVNLIANATADINDILKATQGSEIELKGQKDGLFATKSGRTNRGLWYLQTDTTELAQGADAYITYTYVIRNEGDEDYLSKTLIDKYNEGTDAYKEYLVGEEGEEGLEKLVKDKIKSKGFTKGEYLSRFYYTGNSDNSENSFNPTPVLASVEQIQEALNPKVKFVNSTTDFTKADRNDGNKYPYYNRDGELQEDNNNIKEIITSKEETSKKLLQTGKTLKEINNKNEKKDFINNTMDTSKKLVVSVGLSASEIENGGVYDSYIAQVTYYTNAAGRRDQSTPENLSYVHSEDTNMNMESYKDSAGNMITAVGSGEKTTYTLYKIDGSQEKIQKSDIVFEKGKLIYKGSVYEKLNEQDEFWAERFTITKPTGEDKITPVQIAIITISAVAVLGVGIILIKKFVLKK